MSCGDLCSAAKCAELENRIEFLEEALSFLQNAFDVHRNESIPQAHTYQPTVTTVVLLDENILKVDVDIDGHGDEDSVELPNSVVPNVTCDVFDTPDGGYTVKVGVNGEFDESSFYVKEPELSFAITEIIPGQFDFEIVLGDQLKHDTLFISLPGGNQPTALDGDFAVDVSYVSDYLNVAVTIDGTTRSDSAYIDADVLTVNRGSFGSGNNGGNDVSCQEIGEALQFDLGQILAAIAAVDSKVSKVQEYVTIDVEGTTITEFECAEEAPEGEEQPLSGTEKEYEGKGIAGLHEIIKITLNNQLAIYNYLCANPGVLAFPAWWQVRLGANVPQIVCSFRKAGTSTYHYLAIPHPASTEKPTKPLLPAYTKGNWQGMITCKDNSKFIINCNSQAEAERMCTLAIDLIDGDYLELPPRIYVGERKGQGVSVDSMTPSTVSYFKTGQQNFVPNWRVRVSKLVEE